MPPSDDFARVSGRTWWMGIVSGRAMVAGGPPGRSTCPPQPSHGPSWALGLLAPKTCVLQPHFPPTHSELRLREVGAHRLLLGPPASKRGNLGSHVQASVQR